MGNRWIDATFAVAAFFAVAACSSLDDASEGGEEATAGNGLPPVPEFLLAGAGGDRGGTSLGGSSKLEGFDFSEIEFTDPDNPDKPIPLLDQAFREGMVEEWDNSYTRALETAMRRERPVIMWFTDSDRSPICKRLEEEVWRSKEFRKFAKDRVVRVKFDFNITEGDSNTRFRKKKYLEGLKKQYQALGLPTVVILTPDGQFVHRERGYTRGQAEFYYQKIKFRVEQAEQRYEAMKKRLEKSGYRDWKSAQGTRLFAKPVAFREGKILLQRIDKKRQVVRLDQLSRKDRKWVEAKLEAAGR